MKKHFNLALYLMFSILLFSCSTRSNLYEITDRFVESLQTDYQSYGLLGGSEYKTLTEDGQYQVMPTGRLINVKIMKVATDEEYEDLQKDLQHHYKNNHNVNDVYRCQAGTLMIDCRN